MRYGDTDLHKSILLYTQTTQTHARTNPFGAVLIRYNFKVKQTVFLFTQFFFVNFANESVLIILMPCPFAYYLHSIRLNRFVQTMLDQQRSTKMVKPYNVGRKMLIIVQDN